MVLVSLGVSAAPGRLQIFLVNDSPAEQQTRYYRWVYRTVLEEGEKIRTIVEKHGLTI
jgi:hypothetical protein